jgi:hypothetical protein
VVLKTELPPAVAAQPDPSRTQVARAGNDPRQRRNEAGNTAE